MPPAQRNVEEPPRKKRRLSRKSLDKIIRIKVGPHNKIFEVYQALLCDVSAYFESAVKVKLEEGAACLSLQAVKVQTFERFYQWLYTGTILETEESLTWVPWPELFDLYMFAEDRGIPELQNVVIDEIIDKEALGNDIPALDLTKNYDELSQGSQLKKLAVDFVAHLADLGTKSWSDNLKKPGHPRTFLIDLAVELSQISRGKSMKIVSFKSHKARYHVKVP